ncbi:MAG TPA: GNAT family protein [Gemmatimonadaceae bacterium]
MIDPTPVVLDGIRVRLEPMTMHHLDALAEAGGYDELWRWTRSNASTREQMQEYMEEALASQRAGTAMPFVTIDKPSSTIVGSTRFGNIDIENRKVEIGWTWVTPRFQRTYVNSEAKYLMLTRAFDVWGCVRVELKTDLLNAKSRAAMLRLGALEEGVLRRHMITQAGRYRDTIYYSILDDEWPTIRNRLRLEISRVTAPKQ